MIELPHSDEMERAFLACILLRPAQNMRLAQAEIPVADLYFERHREIFGAMDRISFEDGPEAISIRTLQADLERHGKYEFVGGLAYLSGLDLDLPDLGQFELYIDKLRDMATRRRAIELASILAERAAGPHAAADTVAWLQARAIDLGKASSDGGYAQAGDVAAAVDIERQPGQVAGITTGLVDLDRAIQGLEPGCQVVIGGRPGHGKSALFLSMALAAARAGSGVGLVSLEMPASQVGLRLLAMISGINSNRIRAGMIGQGDREKLRDARAELSRLPLWVDTEATQTPEKIAARAAQLKAEHSVSVIGIDYLGLVSGRRAAESEALRIGEISRRLKLAAMDLDVCTVILHQLNREVERRADHEPVLADLRSSGDVEQDADVVIFVVRQSLYGEQAEEGKASLLIRKQRQGEVCKIAVAFDGPTTTFRDLYELAP